jgi:hypothetical protein
VSSKDNISVPNVSAFVACSSHVVMHVYSIYVVFFNFDPLKNQIEKKKLRDQNRKNQRKKRD